MLISKIVPFILARSAVRSDTAGATANCAAARLWRDLGFARWSTKTFPRKRALTVLLTFLAGKNIHFRRNRVLGHQERRGVPRLSRHSPGCERFPVQPF